MIHSHVSTHNIPQLQRNIIPQFQRIYPSQSQSYLDHNPRATSKSAMRTLPTKGLYQIDGSCCLSIGKWMPLGLAIRKIHQFHAQSWTIFKLDIGLVYSLSNVHIYI